MTRNFQKPGRSPVFAENGMAATSHPLATATAVAILKDGGNAIDAAIAASAVLAVVEPQMTGIGGDCFAIVAKDDGAIYGLNGSGRAPAAAKTDWFLEKGITSIEATSPHSVTVPGAVKAWETLAMAHGSRELGSLFEAAIRYADDGFPVTPRVQSDWAGLVDKMKAHPGARSHYLKNDKAPSVGDRHHLPALAQTLRQIAKTGSKAFYQGPIAEDMIATLQGLGGLMTMEDLAACTADPVDLISTSYGGVDIHEIPPNGQGIIALIILNILKRFDLQFLDPHGPERAHLEIEAGRLAYGLRDLHVADPASMTARVDTLLSDALADKLAASIDPNRRNETLVLPDLPGSDTVYLTVVDKDRTAVSFINSLYHGFGSGIVTEKTGIALQNRGACFVVEDGHPNRIDAGKRPMHTIIPAMAMKDGLAEMSFGVMGGAYQPVGHAHVMSNWRDYGMDPQAMIDHPRQFWSDDGTELHVETQAPAETIKGLVDRGHTVRPPEAAHGGAQAIQIDRANGFLIGGSDPRKDGSALGY